jgi:hypothetical protein
MGHFFVTDTLNTRFTALVRPLPCIEVPATVSDMVMGEFSIVEIGCNV